MPGREWTMTHAHFLQMGGFHLRLEEYTGVLNPRKFDELIAEQKIPFPKVTKAKIETANDNMLVKCVYLFFTIRFMYQCISRHMQGLKLASLEIITLFHFYISTDEVLGSDTTKAAPYASAKQGVNGTFINF
ncbi:hypothetical protein BDQ17DRAFT_1337870 [Cyathus striatus]|nr:hypothetical protein BDQ17DRAFT_1337870 [Cyathus striatus]